MDNKASAWASSHVLFLLSCSNHKATGGTEYPGERLTLAEALGGSWRQHVLERRRRIYELLMGAGVARNRRLLALLPYNRDCLKDGPDLGGRSSAEYREAFQRYTGRLYREIPSSAWTERKHHVLVLSGLYGFLLPGEPIQRYSCHLADDARILKAWTNEQFSTKLLKAYITRFSIRKVFDLTGERLYRDFISWGHLPADVEALHMFGEQNAGPALLPALGEWLANQLDEGEDQLRALTDGDTQKTSFETLRLSTKLHAPLDCPDEESEFAWQLRRYYAPLIGETERLLRDALGPRRWRKLGSTGSAQEFLVSGYSMWRMWPEMSDFSPVCIQLSKALETVLHESVTRPAGEALLRGGDHVPEIKWVHELYEKTRKGKSLALGWMGEIIGLAQHGEGARLPREVVEKLLSPLSDQLSASQLARGLKKIADNFRNGLAHTARADKSKALDCVVTVVGEVDENPARLRQPGLLIKVLDSLIRTT